MAIKNYDQYTITKLHRAQLENLKCFANICYKNNLHWFLCYGSLIGAVRHGGFIPWDDDLDVAMLREDYEKFIDISHSDIEEGFEVLSVKYEKTYQRPFARVQLKGTRYIEPSMEGADTKEGIYIDVFVFDRVPANEEEAHEFMRKATFWQIIYGALMIEKPQIAETGDAEEIKKRKQWKLIHDFGRITHFPKKFFWNKFEKISQKYRYVPTGYVACIKGSSTAIQQENWCKDTISWGFEGIRVEIPKEYDALLTHCYGNYRKIKRYNHNPVQMDFGEWNEKLDDGWQDVICSEARQQIAENIVLDDVETLKKKIENKKVLLVHFTNLGFLTNSSGMLEKLEAILSDLDNRDTLPGEKGLHVIISPTYLLEQGLKELCPDTLDRYREFLKRAAEYEDISIVPIDELRRREEANLVADLSDAFYGDYSAVAERFVDSNKPVMMMRHYSSNKKSNR